MRLFQIALVVIISSSLLLSYSNPVTAAGAKSSAHNRSHKSHGRKSSKQSASVGDVWERIRHGLRIPRPSPVSAGFDPIPISATRILSRPVSITEALRKADTVRDPSAPTVGSARKTTIITPQKLLKGQSPLTEKYTRLGRSILGPKSTSNTLNNRLTSKLRINPKDQPLINDSLLTKKDNFKSPSVQRIRTRLGLHPELFKHADSALAEASSKNASSTKNLVTAAPQQHPAIRRCSDLNKQTVNSARQDLLAGSYSQLTELCRIKQDSIYQRVSRQISRFSQDKGFLYQSSERARPYLYHVVDALSKYGLPLDLALLPIVESGYQATALSPMNAAGIWQFIPSTGKEFGLDQNAAYDGRLDVTASTHAAIRFLSGLNQHFNGDWLLTLAAYNSGQGTVDAAINRNLAEGLDTDYWSLALPEETQDYVPRLLALSSIFASPGSYGLKLKPVRNELHFIKVNIDRETDINHIAQKDIKTVAKLADFDTEEFSLLNAAYRSPILTQQSAYSFLLPINHANQLHQSLAFLARSNIEKPTALSLNPEIPLFSTHAWPKIQTPLLAINFEDKLNQFAPKQFTSDEAKPIPTSDETFKTATSGYLAVHYLDKGESLKVIAENHGISEEVLRGINKFKRRQSISLGQPFLIPLKKMLTASIRNSKPSVLFKDITDNFGLNGKM